LQNGLGGPQTAQGPVGLQGGIHIHNYPYGAQPGQYQYGAPHMAHGPTPPQATPQPAQGAERTRSGEQLSNDYWALDKEEDKLHARVRAGESGPAIADELARVKQAKNGIMRQMFTNMDRQMSADRAAGLTSAGAPHVDAVNQQLDHTRRNPKSVHIEKGFELLRAKEGKWRRWLWGTALVAGGVLATAAVTPALPVLFAPWVTGALTGAGIFGTGGLFRAARRVDKAVDMIRLAYGPDVKVTHQLRKTFAMTGRAMIYGATAGGLLAATPAGELVRQTAAGWLCSLENYLAGSEKAADAATVAENMSELMTQLGNIMSSAGEHVYELFTTWPPEVPTGQQLASTGLAAGAALAAGGTVVKTARMLRRTGAGPGLGGIDIGRSVTPEETWRNANLSPQEKARLVQFAKQAAPGESDMRKVVRNQETDVKLLKLISASGMNPRKLEAAFAPLRQLREGSPLQRR
jgi:hypothetical protein